jgi:lipopolysaccharide biosynthesis glycosyltransferase
MSPEAKLQAQHARPASNDQRDLRVWADEPSTFSNFAESLRRWRSLQADNAQDTAPIMVARYLALTGDTVAAQKLASELLHTDQQTRARLAPVAVKKLYVAELFEQWIEWVGICRPLPDWHRGLSLEVMDRLVRAPFLFDFNRDHRKIALDLLKEASKFPITGLEKSQFSAALAFMGCYGKPSEAASLRAALRPSELQLAEATRIAAMQLRNERIKFGRLLSFANAFVSTAELANQLGDRVAETGKLQSVYELMLALPQFAWKSSLIRAAVQGALVAASGSNEKLVPELKQTAPAAGFSEGDFFAAEHERVARRNEIGEREQLGMPLGVVEREILADRIVPPFARGLKKCSPPPSTVAFLTVANDRFLPGLEMMLRSLLEVYPELSSDIHVCHDGTLRSFAKRRLERIYPRIKFCEPDMDWFENVPQRSDNHKRIGKLGYMNIHALSLTGYERVVVLDSDLIILGDISELWAGDDWIVCYDAGDREYAVRSSFTGSFVFNSGVISVPGSATGTAAFHEMQNTILESATAELCPIIDRFADQKVWNIFLRNRKKRFAALNYNCNVKFLVKSLGGDASELSVIHFAGPKPWNSKDYVHESLLTENSSRAVQYPRFWIDRYKTSMSLGRLRDYAAYAPYRRRAPVQQSLDKTCLLIGNGPSIARTDLASVAHLERFCFNWFVLHERFDEIRPDHLVLASHQFFGGWNTQTPQFPHGYLERLLAVRHRPVIWTSFYFRELFEELDLGSQFEINYFLFEKPFKRFVDRVGRYNPDIDGFLDDARTGVLTAAIPIALSMGFSTVLLAGCDSNYNQPGTTDKYFYDSKKHTSLETNTASLTSTWTNEGRGQFAYQLALQALQERGAQLIDCTVDGSLRLPKGQLGDFREKR